MYASEMPRVLCILLALISSCLADDFYSLSAIDIAGNKVSLEQYRGTVSLVTNVASECGFTDRHYKQFVKVQSQLGKAGLFNVLAFPCNQFGAQEPKSNDEIAKWAKKNYGVNFPMFSKGNVVEENVPEVWTYLKRESGLTPNWNFWKYLVDIDGQVLNAWGPWSDVEEIFPDIMKAVDNAMATGPRRQNQQNVRRAPPEGLFPSPNRGEETDGVESEGPKRDSPGVPAPSGQAGLPSSQKSEL